MLLLVFQNVDETTDVSSRPQFPEEVRSAIGCSSQTFYKDLQLMRFFLEVKRHIQFQAVKWPSQGIQTVYVRQQKSLYRQWRKIKHHQKAS